MVFPYFWFLWCFGVGDYFFVFYCFLVIGVFGSLFLVVCLMFFVLGGECWFLGVLYCFFWGWKLGVLGSCFVWFSLLGGVFWFIFLVLFGYVYLLCFRAFGCFVVL